MNTKNRILLCCDLDRTVLPNGKAPVSPGAQEIFSRLTAHDNIILAYVSGRDKNLLLQAIAEYSIPVPDFAIGDVGTTIYHIEHGKWNEVNSWQTAISHDWGIYTARDIMQFLTDIDRLNPQEAEKQNKYKVSYYTPADVDKDRLLNTITSRLAEYKILANLIWSIDEMKNTGLLDILPASANKLHAIEFLIGQNRLDKSRTVFAGDSGNDLPVITSNIPSVLVNNASEAVKQEAIDLAKAKNNMQFVYLASGNFHGMNGNYCAGILEGLVHYHPELDSLIK